MTERETILHLLRLGWSERRIAREGGYHRATIHRLRCEAGLLPAKCTTPSEVPTDSGVPTDPKPRSSAEPFRAFIEAELEKRRNATAIYQDLVEHHGYTGSYDAVKRLARRLRTREPKISCRFETAPGQEAQVDYGEGAPTRDHRSGKYRRPRLFVMTLSNSRHAFRKTVWKSSTEMWCRLHEEAFAFFGGTVHAVRLDNLKEGVLQPDIWDPQLNPLYAKMLEHYGTVPLPCRPYAPDLKGKVESAVGYTQATALKGRRFESIEEQNAFVARWNERWAATRIHGTTKRQVRAMFEEERPFLLPLPVTRFEYYRICQRSVHFDGHIEVDGAYYSVPPRYAGSKVIVHVGRLWLRIIDPKTHACAREHPIALHRGQRRTADADRPRQTPPSADRLAARIALVGPNCGTFAQRLLQERGATALRALFGMLDLLRRYDPAAVERACSFAAALGTASLRFVRSYLAHHATPAALKSEHHIIPEIQTYTTHFSTLTQGVTA
ncbi:IS21 family transposase [bacterium]|nr:MAG: IS21 family transposase [bacterium]